ncbi:unnamed protein product [Ilex paraguariensis]|uniref:ATP synthase CF0 subunit I n=1 Tax=Ilex paraguariensis TaxID=185542 RepID=A0ABC8U6D2_9AQUA
MALFQGPTLFGYGEIDFAAQSQISAREPEPAGWLLSSFLNFGIDLWHLGVLCLIGNCICMAAYIAIQDSTKITNITNECKESTNLIPQLEEDIPKLQKLFLDEEKVLEEIKENSKGIFFKEQEKLIPLEQAARQKVTELLL